MKKSVDKIVQSNALGCFLAPAPRPLWGWGVQKHLLGKAVGAFGEAASPLHYTEGSSTISRRWRMASGFASTRCCAPRADARAHRAIRRSGPVVHFDWANISDRLWSV